MKDNIMKIVLATHNRDKIKELKAAFGGTNTELLTFDHFPGMPDVVEDGETLEKNAQKKATEIYHYTGLPALADDTGLEVRALNGAPGVKSSRYAGEGVTYAQNVEKLLFELREISPEQREARFRTVMVYFDGKNTIKTEGCVQGRILTGAAGTGGFGYDPIFYYPPLKKTFSELNIEEKNQISHRGKALFKMIDALCEMNLIKEV
ncbi:MAG TPA: RdgB/HAM1 family non-canonical purine NTP pyrophosphatase [Candidatus Marinimicrobia bacterium]|nr:RdgB/HAM1 family non-canonical purine NTP pyrophosphatase [Candidatus Neomarinimicrobiota bacterium]